MESMKTRAAGEVGRLLASAELLKNGFGVSKPEDDIGFDLISSIGSTMKRIQVKTLYKRKPENGSETFSVRRRRYMRPAAPCEANFKYRPDEIDAFVFVSLVTHTFWVVPASELDLNGHKRAMRKGNRYHNAWHFLANK
jgi:hypothetical protein